MPDLLTGLLQKIIPGNLKVFLKQTAENVICVYLYAFIGFALASPKLNIDTLEIAATSAIPAALTAVKGVVAARRGDLGTTSFVSVKPVTDAVATTVDETTAPVTDVVQDVVDDASTKLGVLKLKTSRRKKPAEGADA